MKTIIMAGGKGTRIRSIASDIPKPMIPIEGKPVLEHEIVCLREQGLTDLTITVSHLGSVIMDYFGDGRKFGVNIQYFNEERPLGNAGALFKLRDQLTEDFLLINADAIFDIDFNRLVSFHKKNGALVTLFAHPNDHPYDSGLLILDEKGYVKQWLTKEDVRPKWYKNRVNAGLHVINPIVLDMAGIDPKEIGQEKAGKIVKIDLDRQILKPLCGTNKIICYTSPEYLKDMGTPERFRSVCQDFEEGRIQARNLRKKQKAIFLDRDGTINKYVGFLKRIEDFELLPGVASAIRAINESGYLAIVATNQPVIARGEVSFAQLEEIHDKMETLLGQSGAYLNGIYFCPHHPDKGFEGEIESLKIECECRKPKAGMLLKAAEDFNIDLSQSWMIGDSENDISAGKSAGCRTIFIGNEEFGQDETAKDLSDAVSRLLRLESAGRKDRKPQP